MLVKILGALDILSAIVFLSLIFNIQPLIQIILFFAGMHLLKSFFIITDGDVLSFIDFFAFIVLLLSIFLTMPTILLWLPAFFLLAKGCASFF